MVDIRDIRSAAERIHPYVKRTHTELSRALSERLNTHVYVKYELFQKTGSFKPRGAFNKMLQLSPEEKKAGVVAVSGGNHAQAVAYASSVLNLDAVILMPENTPSGYLEATRHYGATIDLRPDIGDAFAGLEAYQQQGRVLIHPFDDDAVIAGQGTVGLEIMDDVPQATDIIASIGGGGMAAGVALAAKSVNPALRAWGVETEGADAMSQAFAAGRPVTIAITSIAKTLGAPFVTDRTLNLIRDLYESVTVVPDSEAVDALLFIAQRLKVITEPAAACTLAAADRLHENFTPQSHVVLVLCGGNTSIPDACGYIAGQ
ncbi:MAG: threonine/serine dehydratase [Chloracidobacterium sp.]|nr:threonine/serine dehydratase [Chloracidobacterium sp.]